MMEEWLKIALEEIQKLYDLIPRRIEAVVTDRGPTPYWIKFVEINIDYNCLVQPCKGLYSRDIA